MRDVMKLCIRNAINDAAGGGCTGLAQHEIDEIVRDLSVEIEAALAQARAEGAREAFLSGWNMGKARTPATENEADGLKLKADMDFQTWLRSQSKEEG